MYSVGWTNKCMKKNYGLLTKPESKMAGNWPHSFFFVSLWTETELQSPVQEVN